MGRRCWCDPRAAGHRGPRVSLLLLDTTVLIDAERDPTAADDVIADDDDTAIAAVTVAELHARRSSTRSWRWSR